MEIYYEMFGLIAIFEELTLQTLLNLFCNASSSNFLLMERFCSCQLWCTSTPQKSVEICKLVKFCVTMATE